jgi:transposase InsO family protein
VAWELKAVEEQRMLLIEQYASGEYTVTELSERFCVSRKTVYKWIERHEKGEGLNDKSRRPHAPFKHYADDIRKRILDLKLQKLSWGPKKILGKLQRDFPRLEWPSITWVHEYFKKHNLVDPRKFRRRVPATHPLEHANESNVVWALDFMGYIKALNGEKWEPLTITDCYSRYSLKCCHLKDKTGVQVWKACTEVFEEYGLPLRIRTDNGPPFGSVGVGRLTPLSVNLIKTGITPEWINPGHPEENGRHERFHLTLQKAIVRPFAQTAQELTLRAASFQKEYNSERPHESLQMHCPADYYMPSKRHWDGKLKSPEYDTSSCEVRKVGSNGCVWIRQKELYLSCALSGEYIGLREAENGREIFFGPVILGTITPEDMFIQPKLAPKKIVRRR